MVEQVDDFLVQKLITPITLGEYFPLEFFDGGMMISTHVVMPQNPLQEHDSHFTPQARRLKVEMIQTFIL